MTDYTERIRQAEQNASKIVDQLIKLKDEVSAYKTSTDVLSSANLKLESLTIALRDLAQEQQKHVNILKELDISSMDAKIECVSKKVNKYFKIILILVAITLLTSLVVLFLSLLR